MAKNKLVKFHVRYDEIDTSNKGQTKMLSPITTELDLKDQYKILSAYCALYRDPGGQWAVPSAYWVRFGCEHLGQTVNPFINTDGNQFVLTEAIGSLSLESVGIIADKLTIASTQIAFFPDIDSPSGTGKQYWVDLFVLVRGVNDSNV